MANPLLSLRSAIHSATGVPRLFGAALKAGASPVQAGRIIAISAAALSVSTRRGAGVTGRVNAVRHFIWQAMLTGRYGVDVAQALAVAQEQGTPSVKDSAVDTHNNAVAQAYGVEHAQEIKQGSVGERLESLADVALRKWDEDELIWIKPS